MPAAPLRPDVVLNLPEGRAIKLRPTHAALEAIERRCDAGLVKIWGRFRTEDVRFSDLAVVLSECAAAAGDPLDYDDAFTVARENLPLAFRAALDLVASAFTPRESKAGATNP